MSTGLSFPFGLLQKFVGITHGTLNVLWQRDTHTLLWAGSRAAGRKITVSGTPNCLNYCEIFAVYIHSLQM